MSRRISAGMQKPPCSTAAGTVGKIRNVHYDTRIPDDTFAVANVQKGR